MRMTTMAVLLAATLGAVGALVLPVRAQDAPPPDTEASTVPPEVATTYITDGGIEVVEMASGTVDENPYLSPGYGFKWQGGSWVEHLGDVDRLKSLKQPEGAESTLRVARITKIYLGPLDPATGLRPVRPDWRVGSWLPEQFIAVEQDSTPELRGLCVARCVRADLSFIVVFAPSDNGDIKGGTEQIEARWLECLGRGSMPAVYGPGLENEKE